MQQICFTSLDTNPWPFHTPFLKNHPKTKNPSPTFFLKVSCNMLSSSIEVSCHINGNVKGSWLYLGWYIFNWLVLLIWIKCIHSYYHYTCSNGLLHWHQPSLLPPPSTCDLLVHLELIISCRFTHVTGGLNQKRHLKLHCPGSYHKKGIVVSEGLLALRLVP